jgi:vacuolar-type H+-ATPase subunit H
MNKKNLKKILINSVDGISNKRMLYCLENSFFPSEIKRHKKEKRQSDNLNDEQKLKSEEPIQDSEVENTIVIGRFSEELEKLYPGFKDQLKKRIEKDAKKIKKISRKKLKKKLNKRIDGIKSKHVLKAIVNDFMPDSLT